MNSSNGPKISQLWWDLSDLKEESYDAVLANEEYKNLRLSLIPRNLDALPNELWFWGSLARVRSRELLHVDVPWFVCSKRMLAALESVGDFPHRVLPAHFREAREGKDGTIEGEYVVLVITEANDLLDRERSEIEYHRDGSILLVSRWVFRDTPARIPPIFKPREQRSLWLVSEECRTVLEENGFKGLVLKPQENIGRL